MKDYRVLNVNDNLVSSYNKGYEQGCHDTLVDIARGKSAIPILKGATNGDMIKDIFPSEVWLQMKAREFNKTWWNALYKGGKEE